MQHCLKICAVADVLSPLLLKEFSEHKERNLPAHHHFSTLRQWSACSFHSGVLITRNHFSSLFPLCSVVLHPVSLFTCILWFHTLKHLVACWNIVRPFLFVVGGSDFFFFSKFKSKLYHQRESKVACLSSAFFPLCLESVHDFHVWCCAFLSFYSITTYPCLTSFIMSISVRPAAPTSFCQGDEK